MLVRGFESHPRRSGGQDRRVERNRRAAGLCRTRSPIDPDHQILLTRRKSYSRAHDRARVAPRLLSPCFRGQRPPDRHRYPQSRPSRRSDHRAYDERRRPGPLLGSETGCSPEPRTATAFQVGRSSPERARPGTRVARAKRSWPIADTVRCGLRVLPSPRRDVSRIGRRQERRLNPIPVRACPGACRMPGLCGCGRARMGERQRVIGGHRGRSASVPSGMSVRGHGGSGLEEPWMRSTAA